MNTQCRRRPTTGEGGGVSLWTHSPPFPLLLLRGHSFSLLLSPSSRHHPPPLPPPPSQGALVFPDQEAVELWIQQQQRKDALTTSGTERGSRGTDGSSSDAGHRHHRHLQAEAGLAEVLMAEVSRLNSARSDYRHFEHVAHIAVVSRGREGVATGTLSMSHTEARLGSRRWHFYERSERDASSLG